ncbi:MAG: hypothetical protein HOU81_21165 [Hamadaea sp.]|uniref:hypothetical protein n=1 Tax=Hamadaea sp. TaxID=2024425 RepID=UPI0018459369|nr:hypothetical protein [Hamadaea sp.]NUR73336.1 hypothetical protein [Hamadaea sp.]NUT21296.1 hypothetical protein [Hamadaea sp.]
MTILTLGVAAVQAFLPVTAPAPQPAAALPDSPVQIAVQTQSSGANTVYHLVLTNTSALPVTTTVVQRMPDGTTSLVADGAAIDGDRVSWSAKVAPKADVTLQSSGALPVPHAAEPVTACVSDAASGRLLDCFATDVAAVAAPEAPWWRRWLPYAALAAALGVLIWLGVRACQRRQARPAREPEPRRPRREVAWWVPVSVAAAAVIAVSAAALVIFAPKMAEAVENAQGVRAHAWNGPQADAELGEQASDGTAHFTIYSVTCSNGKTTTCDVTASVAAGDKTVQLFRSMQRVYTSDTTWVEPDPAALVAANGGDPFAAAVVPGTERLMALRFTVPTGAQPQRLELHDGAFAGGVVLDLE